MTARKPVLLVALAALGTAALGGLLRLPVALPLGETGGRWAALHGPLMICGFLGTVIALERAVGLPYRWPYLAPAISMMAAAHLIAGGGPVVGSALFSLASALFVAVTIRITSLRPEPFTVLLMLGAFGWLSGNVAWLAGRSIPQVLPLWMVFPALTIVGERLDLARFQRPNAAALPLLGLAVGVFLAGSLTALGRFEAGQWIQGAGLLALAVWLGWFDLAWRTVRQPGLPRFMSVCLLSGFGWLAVAGIGLLGWAPLTSGLAFDATMHAFFVGFVFSMIFGHAPVIFPAVLGKGMIFHPLFYLHFGLLHLGLVIRVVGDAFGSIAARQFGGTLNAVALAVFLLNTLVAVGFQRRPRRAD